MALIIEWEDGNLLLAEGKSAILGRDSNVEISINHTKVSRHHLQFVHENGAWKIKDLESSNGTYILGELIKEFLITKSVEVFVGGPNSVALQISITQGVEQKTEKVKTQSNIMMHDTDSTQLVSRDQFQDLIAASSKTGSQEFAKRMTLSGRTQIGRSEGNDVVLKDLLVSKTHAEIVMPAQGGYEVIDLNSANGTFVNGNRIRRFNLKDDDIISIGKTSIRFTGTALEPLSLTGGYSLIANNISVEMGGKKLLQNISFELKPRTLTAVIGPSGAGKSTLLNALTGRRPADYGQVIFAGRDLYESYDELRNRIGLVPQSDLLHTNLTTQKALEYGAALRFPKDTSESERKEKVLEVMANLGLSERADLQIDKLSGGQRKRTSVALELLTEPVLLFLDEPTSGLDPGLDRQVMKLLRDLADAGRTVIVVTHSVANLDICDDIVVLAPGGLLAYFGPPKTILRKFESSDWADVFTKLEQAPSDFWRDSGFTAQIKQDLKIAEKPVLPNVRQQSWAFQLMTLCKRYIDVIISDKSYVALLLILPLIIATVGFVVGDDYGLGEGPVEQLFLNPQARSLLLVLILGATFMGTAGSIQELVKERTIYERERSIGLSRSAYAFSKVIVLGIIVIAQAIIFTILSLAGRPKPSEAVFLRSAYLEIIVIVALLAFVSMLIGLLISALINSSESAMPSLVVVTMSQVILSGAVPIRFTNLLEVVGIPNPSYWAMNAFATTLDLNSLLGYEGVDSIGLWNPEANNFVLSIFLLFSFSLILYVLILLILRKREK